MIYRFIYFPLIHRALYWFPQNTPRRSTVTLRDRSCFAWKLRKCQVLETFGKKFSVLEYIYFIYFSLYLFYTRDIYHGHFIPWTCNFSFQLPIKRDFHIVVIKFNFCNNYNNCQCDNSRWKHRFPWQSTLILIIHDITLIHTWQWWHVHDSRRFFDRFFTTWKVKSITKTGQITK